MSMIPFQQKKKKKKYIVTETQEHYRKPEDNEI